MSSLHHMEWIATAVAIVAAIVAGWQAWEARRARLDARSSAGEAQQHEERAAAASERIASAVEERNAAERADRETYRDPWSVTKAGTHHDRRYRFLLRGDEPVTNVQVMTTDVRPLSDDGAEGEAIYVNKPSADAMRPGESMTVNWQRHDGSPSQISVEVLWTRPNGDRHDAAVTLD